MNTLIHSSDHTGPAGDPPEGLSVGAQLRAARLSRGLSLDDICRETRVVKDYLIAVEEENFDRLPSKAYVRGIIRAYAGCVGLPADELVARYDRVIVPPSHGPGPDEAPASAGQHRPARWEKGWWIVPLSLLGILLVVALIFRDNRQENSRPQDTGTALQSRTVPVAAQKQYSSHGGDRPVTAPAQPVAASPAQPSETPSGIFLKLKADRDSGLTITIDGTLTQRYDLKAGDLIEWKGERSFSVDIDNPAGVEAEFNGKPLSLAGGGGGPVHLELHPDQTP